MSQQRGKRHQKHRRSRSPRRAQLTAVRHIILAADDESARLYCRGAGIAPGSWLRPHTVADLLQVRRQQIRIHHLKSFRRHPHRAELMEFFAAYEPFPPRFSRPPLWLALAIPALGAAALLIGYLLFKALCP